MFYKPTVKTSDVIDKKFTGSLFRIKGLINISFIFFILSTGIVIGVFFVSPYITPRYEIHNKVMKLDTWTGQTWVISKSGWRKIGQ